MKKTKSKKRWTLLIVIAVILALMTTGVIAAVNRMRSIMDTTPTYTVTRVDIASTAVGSGRIASASVHKQSMTEGTLTSIEVQPGDFVQPGDVLAQYTDAQGQTHRFASDYEGVIIAVPTQTSAAFEIASLERLQINIQVTERDVFRIQNEQTASIYIDALSHTVQGRVQRVSRLGRAAGDYAVFDVSIAFDNDHEHLYLGMTGSARIKIDQRENVLRVPVEAIVESDGVRYVVGSDRLDHPARPVSDFYIRVETGLSDYDYVEIVNGLTEGDSILLAADPMSAFMRGFRVPGR